MLSALCQPVPRPSSRQGASSAPSHTQVKALEETSSCSRKFTNSANLISLIMGGDGVDSETEGKIGIASTLTQKAKHSAANSI